MKAHSIEPETWPTAERAARSRWFSPVQLGRHCTARTRTWVPAMVPWRATVDGFVTQDVLDWYGRFAEGRPGVIVVEATGIRDVPSGPLLRIGHDRFIDGLRRLADVVRSRSAGETKLFIQLIDFLAIRRRPEPGRFFERFFTVTPAHRTALRDATGDDSWLAATGARVAERFAAATEAELESILGARELEALRFGARERVTDMHLAHIRELPRVLPGLFAEGASRAERAGFDGVELHYAHAYTMASFLSALNDRDDGYGGSRSNRVRLPLEVYAAVRAALRDQTVVGCRYLGDDVIEGGNRIEDAREFGRQFARAGFDFLSLSKGGKFEDAKQPRVGEAAYPYTGASGHECMPTVRIDERGPFGRNLHLAREVRAAIRAAGFETPVVASGGVNSFEMAESALERGDADVIASARQTLADPDWFEKIRVGRGEDVRRCKFTNYCEALDQLHKQVTCQLWDKFRPGDTDTDSAPRSSDGKRRLVAPGWKP